MATRDSLHAGRAQRHAIERARQRYRVRLSARDYQWLCGRLKLHKGQLLGVQPDGNEVWVARWHDVRMVAVYDRDLRRIVTFLPRDATVNLIAETVPRSSVDWKRPRDIRLPADTAAGRLWNQLVDAGDRDAADQNHQA